MNLARSFNEWRKYRQTVNELGRMSHGNCRISASLAPTSRALLAAVRSVNRRRLTTKNCGACFPGAAPFCFRGSKDWIAAPICKSCIAALQQKAFCFFADALSSKHRSDAPPPAELRVTGSYSSSQGPRRNSGTPPPSRCSVLFEKPAAPPPAAGFFVFGRCSSVRMEKEQHGSVRAVVRPGGIVSLHAACKRPASRMRGASAFLPQSAVKAAFAPTPFRICKKKGMSPAKVTGAVLPAYCRAQASEI